MKYKIEKSPEYKIIETKEQLKKFVETIGKESVIAVDLEADSMYHFKEKVCLVQIATLKVNALIDPLKISDMSYLAPIFANPNVKKVFHGADYDIRSLHRDFGIEVRNLLDTQLICRFLGTRETGLEAVLQKQFNVTLDKKYQRKDWSQRPLPKPMLEYAARDTIYLIPLAQMLEKKLQEKNRLKWVREECRILSKVRASAYDGEPLYLKFKGAGRMRPRNLGILESLLQFRLNIAAKKDRPPFKILGNNSIIKIVESRPVTLKGLEKTNALSRKQIQMYGHSLINAVQKALKIPDHKLPVYPRRKAPVLSPKVPDRVKAIKQWRDALAENLGMDPALICNKLVMTAVASKNPLTIEALAEVEEIKKWQLDAFGKDIIRVLQKYNK